MAFNRCSWVKSSIKFFKTESKILITTTTLKTTHTPHSNLQGQLRRDMIIHVTPTRSACLDFAVVLLGKINKLKVLQLATGKT
jgi:hypothetical protein